MIFVFEFQVSISCYLFVCRVSSVCKSFGVEYVSYVVTGGRGRGDRTVTPPLIFRIVQASLQG